uniref:pyocin knob domain-containing protein n=1 Tax=uncultured Methanobrevibacter sp. TaxID=253161 RepID=UPI0025D0AA9F
MKELIANILGLVRVFHFTKEETFNRETINEKISTAITNLSNTVDYKLANKSDNTHKHQKSDITNLVNADSKHDGLMISSDKVKLDNIEAGANKIIIDDALNKNSHNPVENAAIVSNIYNKTEITDLLANIDVGHGKLLSINVTEDGILQVDADSFEYYTTDEVDAELAKKTVSFEKQNVADEGFFSTYVLKQNGVQVGPKMNIPKDMLPISGSVKTVTTPNTPVQGYKVGDKYLDIVLNTIDGTGNDNHLYILATDFVDDYGADNITLQLVNRTFSIKDKGVSKAKLADNVQTSLGYADTFNSSPCKNITSDNIADWNNKAETDDIPVNVSELANDAGYITQHQDISGKVNVSDIKDNLASTDANKPLSAKQGKALNDKFSNYATKESVDNIIYGHADLAGYVKDNDARLSDSRTPKNHTHGNLSNDGKIGSTANLPVITGTGGVLQASSFGTGANTFCQGNDSRLNDSRVPKFAVITANESSIKDLNNYTAGGFYYCSDDAYSKYIIHCPNSNGTNTPYGGNRSFFLLVETWGVSSSNYLKQTLTYYNDNKTYTRTCNSGTWSSWKEISADTTYSPATTSTNGLMSSADKTKLDGIDNGANKITVDHELSSSSTNPIQNKVINAELSNKLDKSSSDTGFVKSNGSIVGFGTTGTTVAKGDHTHPTDTSRVAVAQGSGSANKSLCTDGNGNVTVEAKNNHTHSYVATSQGTGNSGKFLKVNSSGNVICESVTVPSEISVDSSLSSSSTNPVQNKVINTALSGKANSSHSHGNLSNDGKIGSTANLPVITGTNGVLQASSFGTGANTFCQGNDSRLSNARIPIFNTVGASSSSTKDLNNFTTGGFYYCDSDGNAPYVSNQPRTSGQKAFFLLVETWGASSPNYTKQTLTYYDTNQTYTRTKAGSNTGWKAWVELSKDTNTTYSVATQSANGLLSSTDKKKLDGITESADSVSFTQTKTSGIEIGKININGTSTTLYQQDNNTTYTPASALPLRLTGVNGSVGTSAKYAREDHVHPRYVNYGESNTSSDGYFKLFRVSVGSWCNQPFVFKIIRRGATQENSYKLRFTNVDVNTTLPTVSSLYNTGDEFNLWVYNNQNKTFDIIVKEPETYFTCNVEFCDAMNLSITDLKTRLTATEFNNLTASNLTKSTYIGFTSAEKTKLNGIATGANNYSHPTNLTALSSDLYKITTNNNGHVTAGSKVTIDSTPANNANNLITSKAVYDGLSGKANSSHTHSYLPLSGGDITGRVSLPIARDSTSNTDNSNIPWAGTNNLSWDTDMWTTLKNRKSLMGTFSDGSKWWNVISNRHRNGNGDGTSYGMYLRTTLQDDGHLLWAKQKGTSSFMAERTILDSSNYSTYANKTTITNNLTTSTTGTALDASQGKWLKDNTVQTAGTGLTKSSNTLGITNGGVGTNQLADKSVTDAKLANYEYINGTQTASTSAWTGVTTKLTSTTIPTGTIIYYRLNQSSTSTNATLELKLSSDNTKTTGAKAVYLDDRRVTTHFRLGSIIPLRYDGTNWIVISPYTDNNTTYSKGNGLLLSGTTFSADFGTGTNQVARGDHTHSNYLTSHQDISGKENTSNKVTSISSSSTDTQYPSAKAVYNGLSGKSSTGHKHTGWTAISDVIT